MLKKLSDQSNIFKRLVLLIYKEYELEFKK